eukprot:TRINITY_DN2180_c0_g1_i1.p1 TRINITY_DN2180_c0_g1~~TRINITY_DN2180_c0_g1_i1.p1  ORF type:complete len:70 (-),score=10.08 TRINITY_DN2180_c0_g1_i1:397-606(-)
MTSHSSNMTTMLFENLKKKILSFPDGMVDLFEPKKFSPSGEGLSQKKGRILQKNVKTLKNGNLGKKFEI